MGAGGHVRDAMVRDMNVFDPLRRRCSRPRLAQIDAAPKVHARLIAEREAVAPGGTVTVALEQDIRPGWHTYWINPGDAGAPTEIKWTPAAGLEAPARSSGPTPQATAGRSADGLRLRRQALAARRHHRARGRQARRHVTLQGTGELAGLRGSLRAGRRDADACRSAIGASRRCRPIADFAAARAKLPVTSPWPMRYALRDLLSISSSQAAPLASAHPAKAEFFPLAPGRHQRHRAADAWASPTTAWCCA